MLQRTRIAFPVRSHQFSPSRVPMGRYSYGRNYTKSYIRYADGGWGIGTYSSGKDRRFVPANFHREDERPEDRRLHTSPMSRTTKTLSPHFRPFALADGGVLFIHPSQKEILTWTHEVLGEEQKKAGLGNVHDDARSKIQGIIANNTIEHVSVAHWRNAHIRRLMRASLQRRPAAVGDINTSARRVDEARYGATLPLDTNERY